MERFEFIFWEVLKTLSLVFLGLISAKAVRALQSGGREEAKHPKTVRNALYALILALVMLGAQAVGYDTAAEVYFWSSQSDLSQSQTVRAYANALRAVQLRPGNLRYWQALATTKLKLRQFESLLQDEVAFRALTRGRLAEDDAIRFTLAHFLLAHYDQVIVATQELIQDNRAFALPYVLQGAAYTSLKKYADAERSFLTVLQMFPNNQDAVEGLAHLYFLNGDPGRAVAVLNETVKQRFHPEARRRFSELKSLYEQ